MPGTEKSQVKEACYKAKDTDYSEDHELWHTLGQLMEITGAPEKVAYRKLEQCDKRGLVDYGVSLRTCWWVDY